MEKILKTYLRRLTNLSSNNRSLVLLRPYNEQYLDLHDLTFLAGDSSFSIIERLVARNNSIKICPVLDSRDDKSNEASRRLKGILRNAQFILEEQGAADLYVGWPFIQGQFADGTLVRCPLLFFPVALETKKNFWNLHLKAEVNLTLNKTFLLAYSYYNQVQLEEDLVERVLDDFDIDSTVFRTSLYSLLKDSPVEINFNQENFTDKLESFNPLTKADLESSEEAGELKLFPQAVLGIFPQAGSHLVPDYLTLLEREEAQDIEEFFYSRTVEEDVIQDQESGERLLGIDVFRFLDKVKEEQTFTPFEMDAFQENALKAVKRGNSVVVQGPPGTGKSQLICNLISDFIARDRRVLLVCQKRAALDVVYSRLKEKEIADFVALVHDFKNDRKQIYDQINRQIESLYEYRLKNNSLDAIQLERNFLQNSRRIDQITEELEEYKFALFDLNEAGISIKELYLTADPGSETINLKQEYKFLRFDEISNFLRDLSLLAEYNARFSEPNYPWKARVSFAQFGVPDLKKIKDTIQKIPGYQAKVQEQTGAITNTRLDLATAEALVEHEEKIRVLMTLLEEEEVFNYFRHMVNYPDKITDSLWLSNSERIILDCYRGGGPEMSLGTEDLGRFQESLQRSMQARKNLFKWVRWKLFSKDKIFISRVLVANGLSNNRKGFKTLVDKIDNRLNLEHNITKLKDAQWITNVPNNLDKIELQRWFLYQKKALSAKLIFESIRNFKDYFMVHQMDFKTLLQKIEDLVDLINDIPLNRAKWQHYLTSAQIQSVLDEPLYSEALLNSLLRDFDSLCEFDRLVRDFDPHQALAVQRLLDHPDSGTTEGMMNLFLNSLRLTWIDHIETKYPVLRSVSSLRFQKLILELQEKVMGKYDFSNDNLLLRARERTYKEVEYNRLNNLVTYRDLQHQVTKKRRIWPVRKLLANYWDEIFNLVPCWMASPESVSAVFPMKEVFDLVIFDEASQCFVEKGIPAMYRGRQVVIAGDDKQLRPNDLYKARWEEDIDEGIPELEIDSLLSLADQNLMQVQLLRHYRSNSLDLIDFSNQHFYDHKLRVLPDCHDVNRGKPGVKYIKVEGRWEDNCNVVEAYQVAEIVKGLVKKNSDKEIGIVTFNSKQQGLILDILEEEAASGSFRLPSNLIVKNIENIQGDEKDVIIFSIAYAPDPRGKMRMKFGSLNLAGGENRLNVAITRAREAVYVVTSIWPEELKVDQAQNEGPKTLKRYLHYARDVSDGKFKPAMDNKSQYGADWYLRNRIMEWSSRLTSKGFKLECDLPFADITVKKDDHYFGLVLTDDHLYHQSISVKDIHVYTPFTLAQKNWRSHQISSREYWLEKDRVREDLEKFLAS